MPGCINRKKSHWPVLLRVGSRLPALLVLVLLAAPLRAQLSPGDLHKAHAFLEGVKNCTKCHGLGSKLAVDKCLDCHRPIESERRSGQGLHSRNDYRECQNCHVDHQGRNYDLIYWGKGQDNFDHGQTGYRLDGKHASVACRLCHQKKYVKDQAVMEMDKIDLNRTFLGLDTACASCHIDKHRGQLSPLCGNCHTMGAWKPAARFDHDKAKYLLVGKHQQADCVKCHPIITDNRKSDDTAYAKYKDISYDQCLDCHKDLHKGKLGNTCESCHNTEGWKVMNSNAKFDHGRTRYRLEGRHLAVTCDKCHLPRQPKIGLKFAACMDCHKDFHNGDFAKRDKKGACEECHTIDGFTPSRFVMAQHDKTNYPLREAHRAVICASCHIRPGTNDKEKQYQFKFAATRCLNCHKDPHNGELKKYVDARGCESCHVETTWRQVVFDHGLTTFALEGKHAATICSKCHSRKSANDAKAELTFVGAKKICQDCHDDIHRGQFAKAPAFFLPGAYSVDCGKCHSARSWQALTFSHDKDSRYKLEGAHRQVPCQKCHQTKTSGEIKWVVYKPLDIECASCHSDTKTLKGLGES